MNIVFDIDNSTSSPNEDVTTFSSRDDLAILQEGHASLMIVFSFVEDAIVSLWENISNEIKNLYASNIFRLMSLNLELTQKNLFFTDL